jgi:molybdopterin converting factor subunit 1
MELNVLFFGLLRDLFGPSERITVPDETTVADLVSHYREKGAHLGPLWDSIAVAVNQHYAHRTDALMEHDEVALLPPVSGGYAEVCDAD